MERCFIFDEVQPFHKDLATVKLDSHWGVINKSGEWVIKPHYQKLVLLYENLLLCKQNNKEFLINKDEKMIMPFIYDSLAYINRNKYLMIVEKNSKYGVINFKGEVIIPFDYDFISSESNDDYLIAQKENYFGCIDMNNEIILPFEFNNIELGKDFVIVEKDQCYGMLDLKGNQLVPYNYEKIIPFSEGKDIPDLSLLDNPTFIARRIRENNFIIINQNNEQICKQKFDNIFELGEKLYYAKIKSKCCAIDRFGNIKIPLGKFSYIYLFYKLDNGTCVALAQNDEFQEVLINQNGEIIIPFEAGYSNWGFMYTRSNTILMIKDKKFGVIDLDNNVLISFEYDWLFYDGNNFNGALKNGKYGYIDNHGKPLEIENIKYKRR